MTPGRYLARATVQQGGAPDQDVDTAADDRPRSRYRLSRADAPAWSPMSSELRHLTATYIVGLVNGLANVVGQEEFTLEQT